MKTFTTTLTILSLFLSTVYGDSYYGICKVSDQNCHYTLVINGKGSDAQAGCAKVCPLPKRELDSDLRYKEIKANLLFFVFLDRGSIDAWMRTLDAFTLLITTRRNATRWHLHRWIEKITQVDSIRMDRWMVVSWWFPGMYIGFGYPEWIEAPDWNKIYLCSAWCPSQWSSCGLKRKLPLSLN